MRRLLSVCALFALTACDTSKTLVETERPLADPVSEEADLSNDILIAPAAPPLDINYSDLSLRFSWQAPADTSTVRLFGFNTTTATEELISDQISASDNSYTMAIDPKETDLNDWLYSIELCSDTNCISSYRTAVNVPPAAAQVNLAEGADGVLWQPTLNQAGNVLVAVSNDVQSAEVHFKTPNGWVFANSIKPTGLSGNEGNTVDVAMSDNGDTIAIAVHQPQDSQINISLFDRLGEAWVETSQWDTAYEAVKNPASTNLIAMAGDATAMMALNQDGLTRYTRENLDYVVTSTLLSDAHVLTWDASPDLTHLAWLSQKAGEDIVLTRSTFGVEAYAQAFITTGMPLSNTLGASIQINSQGDEILLAGWQNEGKLQASPTIWHAALTNDSLSVFSVQSEAYSGDASAQLILGSSDDLQTSYLSWSDNGQQQIEIYQMNKQSLVQGFDLYSALLLTQPSYELAISGNGSSLSWASNSVFTLEQRRSSVR